MFCGLIIHDVELRLESFAGEFVEVFLVCVKDCFVVQTFDGGGKDEVGFVMISQEEAYTTIERYKWERACEVVVHKAACFVCKCAKAKHVGDRFGVHVRLCRCAGVLGFLMNACECR